MSPLAARLSASHDTFLDERPPGADEDVHMLAALVDHVIERCSRPGDVVLDPFAGFGTTLERAVALGRRAVGIELLPERVERLHQRVPGAQVIEGDAREMLEVLERGLSSTNPVQVNLVLTSPPYMTANDHEADPLTAYEENNGNYDRYLDELGLVGAQCARALAPDGFVVWNVANICHQGHTTELIRDCARALAPHLQFVGVTEIEWDEHPHDLVADALLVFRKLPVQAP